MNQQYGKLSGFLESKGMKFIVVNEKFFEQDMKNLKDIILEKLKVTKHELPELDIHDTDTVIEFLT